MRYYRLGELNQHEGALDLGPTERLEGWPTLGDGVENDEGVAAVPDAHDDAVECLVRGEGRHDVVLTRVRRQVADPQRVLLVGGNLRGGDGGCSSNADRLRFLRR